MASLKKRLLLAWCLLAGALGVVTTSAWAHDPFDGNIQMMVSHDKIEARVTLGYDAARAFFRASGLPPVEVARLTRAGGDRQLVPLPAAATAKLITLSDGARQLQPSAVFAVPSDIESNVLVVYPRPAGQTVRVHANYLDLIEYMRAGTLVVSDQKGRILATALLSEKNSVTTVPLVRSTIESAASAFTDFGAFFRLGVEHILTGFDHLLFLSALLISLRNPRPMLGIVTAFTVSHSITLALAAFDVVAIRPAIVEPLIAASIIVACIANLVRREAPAERYWMAGGFGLIHGFGFAGALREAALAQAGGGLLLPLAGFNIGVEAGQLLVAALLIPLLMLCRRRASFVRYGLPTLSCAILAVSAFWLFERLQMA